jgi:deoxyribodipyrimidine photo-lyase
LARRSAFDPFRERVTQVAPVSAGDGRYIIYWMQTARRIPGNLALDFAIAAANERRLPVVVYESLRPDYPSANDRIHRFVLDGVRANADDAARRGLRYVFFLPRTPVDARGVLRRLAGDAALVVTDEYPAFIIPRQTARFAARSPVPVIAIDGNGMLPMRAAGREMYSAKIFRDVARRRLDEYWAQPPSLAPRIDRFEGPLEVDGWDGADIDRAVASCQIDHSVRPADRRGGRTAALQALQRFVEHGLENYTGSNRHPRFRSALSPYLHFGSIGIHEVAERVIDSDAPDEQVDAFLEQAVIRRELSFNLCFYRPDHESLSVLPEWAKKTLDQHRRDRRKPEYPPETMERAETEDEVWNLSQRELLETGTIHNYLRMLWGKKIIEWSSTPEAAHRFMIEMHDRYAIDGRDPNTHAGVLWCFGKHDRPWAERPILGKLRSMSSEATRRKVALREIVLPSASGGSPNCENPLLHVP